MDLQTTIFDAVRPPDGKKDEHLVSSHLHAPRLRLVYLPYRLTLTFVSIPDIPEGFTLTHFLSRASTTAEVIDAIVEELGIKQVVLLGAKSARIEYSLETDDSPLSSTASPLSSILQARAEGPPYQVRFTLSKAWFAKIGTVAKGLAKDLRRPKLAAMEQKPQSMVEDEEVTTVKGRTRMTSGPNSTPSTRLSTLFEGWRAPVEVKPRVVSDPISVVRPRPDKGGTTLGEDFEQLIVDLGIKGPQQEAMRNLPNDRKRFLIDQHVASNTPSPPVPALRPQKTGGSTSPEPSGALAGWKRMSLASLGWSSPSETVDDETASIPASPRSTCSAFATAPAPTASSWTSWLLGGSSTARTSDDSPTFFVAQLEASRSDAKTLTRHLISLRVRLSTSKIAWSANFLENACGLDVLERLLGSVKGKERSVCDLPADGRP